MMDDGLEEFYQIHGALAFIAYLVLYYLHETCFAHWEDLILLNICFKETTPRRYSPLSFSQRLKIVVDIARCLYYLHDKGPPHGNLRPTNILAIGV